MRDNINENILINLYRVYKNPKYLLTNIIIFLIYYYLIIYLIKLQNRGILLFTSIYSNYLIYLIAISSSILFTISIFLIINSGKKLSFAGSPISIISSFITSMVVGCGCAFPIFISIIAIVLGSAEATYADVLIANNSSALLIAIILINAVISIYYLSRLNSMCKLKKTRR